MNKFVKSSSPSFKYRLISVVVLIALGLVAVLARVGYLQIWQGSHFEDLAKRHQERRVRIEGRRGTIYDRNHRVLASSIEVDSIHTVPGKIEDPEDAAQKLSPLLKIPKDKLLQKLKKQNNFIWLVRQTSPKIAFQVEQLKLKGIGFMKEFRRYYPTGDFGGLSSDSQVLILEDSKDSNINSMISCMVPHKPIWWNKMEPIVKFLP